MTITSTITAPPLAPLRLATCHLQLALARLESSWLATAPRELIHARVRDVERWLESVLDELPLRGALERDHEMLAHDAFLRAIALAQLLGTASEHRWADHLDLALARDAVSTLLDAFEPYLCFADIALRRVVLDGESLDTALERIERELHD